MNIIFFGPPGAGKGTQTNNVVKDFKYFKLSTGDLLREEISKKTLLGKEIKSIIDAGHFVSDNTINSLIEKIVLNKQYLNKLVFDGYPRNLDQAKNLENLLNKHDQKISHVFSLEVSDDQLIKRLTGRKICSKCGLSFNDFFSTADSSNHKCGEKYLEKRSDDNETTAKKRLSTYRIQTLPILEYYEKNKVLYKIDGMRRISEIYVEIKDILSSLKG